MTVTDKFPGGITKEEFEAIESEANRLEAMGYKVPNIVIKPIQGACGLTVTGLNIIYIHPSLDIEDLKDTVRHEIGHNNEPETEFDIWADPKTPEQATQECEDWAISFANRTK